MRLEVRIKRDPWRKTIGFAIIDDSNEFKSVAQPLIMHDVNLHDEITPAFELHDEEAQLLLDELWRAGFRPTEGVENLGQLKATQDHLADMKKLMFVLFDGYVRPEEQEAALS